VKAFVAAGVIALALGASRPSQAAEDLPTSLPLVAPKPIALAPTESHTNRGWILIAAVAAGGVGAWSWKRRQTVAKVTDNARLRVVSRTGIGGRNELVIVDAGGQRLLLGVSASGITTLATLDEAEEREPISAPAPPTSEPRQAATLRARLDAMIESAGDAPAPALRRETVHPTKRPSTASDFAIEGQARGLLALGRGR
jgi:flagellar biogenesis protein FliO